MYTSDLKHVYTLFLATDTQRIKNNIEQIQLLEGIVVFYLIISGIGVVIVMIITIGVTLEVSYFVIKPLKTLLLRLS